MKRHEMERILANACLRAADEALLLSRQVGGYQIKPTAEAMVFHVRAGIDACKKAGLTFDDEKGEK